VIIDPPLGENHHGDGGTPWDAADKAWSAYSLDSCLQDLKKSMKTMTVFSVAVYCNQVTCATFWNVLNNSEFQEVHQVDVYRFGVDCNVSSKSRVLVGTFNKSGGVLQSTGRPTPMSFLSFYLPSGLSPNSRQDISGVGIQDEAGKRQRCVDEYRHFVRVYSEPGAWVMSIHSGIGTSMVASLLEGRHAAGLEPCSMLNFAAAWRLSQFKQTETFLKESRSHHHDPAQPAPAVLLVDELAELLEQDPYKPSSNEVNSLRDVIMDLIKICAAVNPITAEDSVTLMDKALSTYKSRAVILEILTQPPARMALSAFLMENWPKAPALPEHTP